MNSDGRTSRWRLRLPLLAGGVAGLLVFFFAEWLIHLEQARLEQSARNRLQAEVSSVRAHLESEFNTLLSLGLSASAFVSANPGFDAQQYDRLAAQLFAIQPRIRTIAIAPDNVVRYVYPHAGNEAAIGLDLEKVPSQREAVLRVRREWQAVAAGPVNLVQGGLGLLSQVPVLVHDKDGRLRYWGLSSLAIDPLPVFERSGLSSNDSVLYALRGRDGKGAEGEVFLGESALFDEPGALQQEIVIPGGRWLLAARWRDPADAVGWLSWPWHGLAVLLATIAGAVVGFASRSQQRLGILASHDSLTGLANRHQFLEQSERAFALAARHQRFFVLLSLDLEEFKQINDTFGHEAGDALLVHVAGQLRGTLRVSDLIARFGGDEFLALLPETGPGPELDVLLVRLHEAVLQPLLVNGNPVRVNISVGVASFPVDGQTLSDLMRVADARMYADKKSHGHRRP